MSVAGDKPAPSFPAEGRLAAATPDALKCNEGSRGMNSNAKRAFELGQTVITRNALDTLHPDDVQASLTRHARCDWGECCKEDAAENEFALGKYLRLFSVYRDRNGIKFWIITEADRSATTVLLPEDY